MIHLGDNLEILRGMPDDSVDLIATDPPYFTQCKWVGEAGSFGDQWASREAFIEAMREVAVECRRVLKDTGTLYWQCDDRASAPLTLMLEEVFGRERFVTCITWLRSKTSRTGASWPRLVDHILMFGNPRINRDAVAMPLDPEYVKRAYRHVDEAHGGAVYQTNSGSITGPKTSRGERFSEQVPLIRGGGAKPSEPRGERFANKEHLVRIKKGFTNQGERGGERFSEQPNLTKGRFANQGEPPAPGERGGRYKKEGNIAVREAVHGRPSGERWLESPGVVVGDRNGGDKKRESTSTKPKKTWRGITLKPGRHWSAPTNLPPWFDKPEGYDGWDTFKKLDELDRQGMISWPKKEGGLPRFKLYLCVNKGQCPSNLWTGLTLASGAGERVGYPTQKPVKLYERIVLASSKPGDVVLDPFCGSGTTGAAAVKHGRSFIGIDRSPDAVKVAEGRLATAQVAPSAPSRPAPRRPAPAPASSGQGDLFGGMAA